MVLLFTLASKKVGPPPVPVCLVVAMFIAVVAAVANANLSMLLTEPNLRHFSKATNFMRKNIKSHPLLCGRMVPRLLFRVLMKEDTLL